MVRYTASAELAVWTLSNPWPCKWRQRHDSLLESSPKPGTQDHTLVNSTRFAEVSPEMEARLRALLALPNAADRHLHELPHIQARPRLPFFNRITTEWACTIKEGSAAAPCRQTVNGAGE